MIQVDLQNIRSFIPLPYEAALSPRLRIAHDHLQNGDGAGGEFTGDVYKRQLMDASIAASRGLGRSVAPTIMVILGSCVFRVIWIYTIFAYFHTITSLYLLYMFSWILTGVAEYIYFRITYKRNVLTARATW